MKITAGGTAESARYNRIYRRLRRILRQLERNGSGNGIGCLITAASYPALVTAHRMLSESSWWDSMTTAFWVWLVILCVWGYFLDTGGTKAREKAAAAFDRYYPVGDAREAAMGLLRSMAGNHNSSYSEPAQTLLEELGEAAVAVEKPVEAALAAATAKLGGDTGPSGAGEVVAPIDFDADRGHIPLEPAERHEGAAPRRPPRHRSAIPLDPDDGEND